MKAIKPIRNGSPRARTLQVLREQLANGIWVAGERVPGEAQLSADVGVSRPTVRAALSVLEDEGLIRSLGRAGRVVNGSPASTAPNVMANTVVVLSDVCADAAPGYHGGSNEAVESGIRDEANAQGLNLLRLHPERLLPQTAEWLRGNRPLAVLLTPEMACRDEVRALAAKVAAAGLPIVSCETLDGISGVDLVLFDHVGGAAALTRWLVEQGSRRILPFWSTTRSLAWIQDRQQGYEQAMRELNLSPLAPVRCDFPARPAERDEAVLEQRTRLSLGYLHEHLLGENRVDAVMLLEDSSVFPFLGACRIAGVKTGPLGVQFTGFDNFWGECWEREIYPLKDLATIDKQNYLAGQEMIRLTLSGRDAGKPPRRIVVPCLAKLP